VIQSKVKQYVNNVSEMLDSSKFVKQSGKVVMKGTIHDLSLLIWNVFPSLLDLFKVIKNHQKIVDVLIGGNSSSPKMAEYRVARWYLGLAIYLIQHAHKKTKLGDIKDHSTQFVLSHIDMLGPGIVEMIVAYQMPTVPRGK